MVYIILFSIVGILLLTYIIAYYLTHSPVKRSEKKIVHLFHEKVSKIPALIEVMRPHVYEERAFDLITTLHTETMIRDYSSIYTLLEQNARIHDQFLFLLKLSVHIPALQKDAYFLYIRDFIIGYDRDMQISFEVFNTSIRVWNRFVLLKNISIIGFFLPGRTLTQV
jgi:hypothetical protein